MRLIEKAHAGDPGTGTWQWLSPAANYSADTITISGVAGTILDLLLLVAGILAVLYLIYSGIIYITAGGNPDNAKKGQQGVINAIIGIVIITLAYFIVRLAFSLGTGISGGSVT